MPGKKSRVPTPVEVFRSAKMTSLSGLTREKAENFFSQIWTYYISLERKFDTDQKSLYNPGSKMKKRGYLLQQGVIGIDFINQDKNNYIKQSHSL